MAGAARSGSRLTFLRRRQMHQRAVMIAMASTVANAIAKNPSAIHCVAPMASAVWDVPVERS